MAREKKDPNTRQPHTKRELFRNLALRAAIEDIFAVRSKVVETARHLGIDVDDDT
eukprot:m.1238631 g.1238631  ORF g.1238631 m.1238631 type:complete len:55 (+) comp24672_c0_seq5:3610-3774(+)